MELARDFYLLRWRLDFATGRSSLGQWSQPGDIAANGAWRQSRAGVPLVRAFVEGKHVVHRTTTVLAECDGPDFINVEWKACAHVGNPLAVRGPMVPYTTMKGLSIVTREEIISVENSGKVTRTRRPEAHKRIAFATYGK